MELLRQGHHRLHLQEVRIAKRISDPQRKKGIFVEAGVSDQSPSRSVRLAEEVRKIRAAIKSLDTPSSANFSPNPGMPSRTWEKWFSRLERTSRN